MRRRTLHLQITLSTGGWLLVFTAFALGFACGTLVEEIRTVLEHLCWTFASPA